MKCRIFMLHKDVNRFKVKPFEALHREYVAYVRICVQHMLEQKTHILTKSQKRSFFPASETLTSQIVKNAQDHAIQIVSTWAKAVYARKIKPTITNLKHEGTISEEDAKALYTAGLKLISKPWKFITQEHINAYNELLDAYGGNKPTVRNSLPMRLSEMTSRLEDPDEAFSVGDLWLRVSSLEYRKSIWLPLVGNPYVDKASQLSKGIQARKTKRGKWRFEAVDKRAWEPPTVSQDADKLGIDIGLNVLATMSDGCLYGEQVKPKFDKLYRKIRNTRANRQRQGLKVNSPRLDHLESKLSGLIKTEAGRTANQIIRKHPDTIFVVEDLNLSGCRGQKRFAYRALQTNLEKKAIVQRVNPAYTSQECPSCGYVSRKNRSGTKFTCRSCGRQAHADWVGASGILRRSEGKGIGCGDHPRVVKRVLNERFLLRRTSSSGLENEPSPLGQKFNVRGLAKASTVTASNSIPVKV